MAAIIIPSAFAVEGVTKCDPNTNCIIGDYVFDNDYNPLTARICNLTVRYPNSSIALNRVGMDNNSDGWHNYTVNFATSGFYRALMECNNSGDYGSADKSFYIGITSETYLQEINQTTHSINSTITNTIIPYLQEINRTTNNSYSYLQNAIYPKLNDANSTIYAVLDRWGTYTASELYQRINESCNKTIDVYADTQALLAKWGTYTAAQLYNLSNTTYYKTISIYSDMATATALLNLQNNITWLIDNVATQENITTLEVSINAIDADVDTLITRTDCSNPANSVLCAYLNNTNSTVANLKTNWGAYTADDIITRLTEINTTTQNSSSYLQNTIYTKLNSTWNNTQQALALIGSSSDDESTPSLFGEHAYTQNRISSIQRNLTEIKTIVTHINLTSTDINSTIAVVLSEVDSLEEMHQCSLTPNSTICALLNSIRNDTQNIYPLVVVINQNVTNIRETQVSDFHIKMSDFGEVAAGSDFRLKLWIANYLGQFKNADSTPTVTLYDPLRNIIVQDVNINLVETGIYGYNYTTSSSQVGGVWEAVVTTVVNGVTNKYSDYWELESSPAEVTITSISDKTVPTITADVTITNEGTGAQEYQYEYCIVSSQNNSCGGADDTCYGSGAKLINPAQSWNTQLTCSEVTYTGDYWFKILVYYGTEVSGASRSFTATEALIIGTGGGGGAAGGAMPTLEGTGNETAETSGETKKEGVGKISITDYPTLIELEENETIAKDVRVKNIGNGTLHNVRLTISGMPSNLYLINPENIDIEPGITQTFTVRFKPIPQKKDYTLTFIASSDEDKQEVSSFLNVVEKPEIKESAVQMVVSSQTWILILILAVVLLASAFIIFGEVWLHSDLKRIEKEVLAERPREEIEQDISKIKGNMQNLEKMYQEEAIDRSSYAKSKERLDKKLNQLFTEFKKVGPTKKEMAELEGYMQLKLNNGVEKKAIAAGLLKIGWQQDVVEKAFDDIERENSMKSFNATLRKFEASVQPAKKQPPYHPYHHVTKHTIMASLLIIISFGFLTSLMNSENAITGFAVLPDTASGKLEVVSYLESTQHFDEFSSMIKDRAVLEKLILCKDENVCNMPAIGEKIENNNINNGPYWYARYSATGQVASKKVGSVVFVEDRKLYLEFVVGASDGKIMQAHIGETPWES